MIALALVLPMAGPVSAAPSYWESDFGTGLGLDDDESAFQSLGFTFYFYGLPYTAVWINANGNLTFVDKNSNYVPNISVGGRIIIAPLYGDFNPDENGDVYYNTLGSPGSRRFIATWHVVPKYQLEDLYNTFQVVLYEDPNIIQFGYNGLTTDGFNWYGPPMLAGISPGTGEYTLSASGSAIPGLDKTNTFSWWNGTEYIESTTFPVTSPVISPDLRGIKAETISELESLLPTGEKKTDKNIEKAIKHLAKSLDGKLWEDDIHLAVKHGAKVFNEEKKAVKELMHLMDKKDIPEGVESVSQLVIDKLIEVDELLATIAFEEAQAFAGNTKVDKELEKCDKELEKAQKELDHMKKDGTPDPKYDKAIKHYKNAWKHAQKAIGKAPEDDEEGGD